MKYEVDGKHVKFHGIFQHSEIVPPSLLVGGHGGGVVAHAYAVVEYDNGTFEHVEPIRLKGKSYEWSVEPGGIVFLNHDIDAKVKFVKEDAILIDSEGNETSMVELFKRIAETINNNFSSLKKQSK